MALKMKCYLCGSDVSTYSSDVQGAQAVQNITCTKGHKYSIDDMALTRLSQLSRRIRSAAQQTVEQDNAKGKTSLLSGDDFINGLNI